MQLTDPQRRHWARNRLWIAALLALWFAVTFGSMYFARDLTFRFFGWPFSVWVAGQGALIVYLGIVWIYQLAMDRVDRSCHEFEKR